MVMKNDWKYLDFCDLVGSQIEETRLSYDTHSKQYAEKWEWNEKIASITKRDYVEPFVKLVKKNGVVMVIGCGTGRDLKVLGNLGYRYLGIDSSVGMATEAIGKRGVDGPILIGEIETLNVAADSFDGVLVDSAIEHIRKVNVKTVLEKLYEALKKDGVLLIRFRIGTGKVFVVKDVVGTRYFTSYKDSESRRLVTSNGFTVLKDYSTNHLDSLRPGFHTYILRK